MGRNPTGELDAAAGLAGGEVLLEQLRLLLPLALAHLEELLRGRGERERARERERERKRESERARVGG